jgi:activating signal cointegrator 1
MKVLSLYEPYASLVAMNLKKNETRSWKTSYRGELYIHACLGMPQWAKKMCPFFATLLGIEEYNGSWLYYRERGVGSFGEIIAKCNLVDCVRIEEEWHMPGHPHTARAVLEKYPDVEGNEYWFGDYTQGRYAWILSDITPIEPIPARGRQRIWNFNG